MKYNYDIKEIEKLVNEGFSVRAIARKLDWCPISTQSWLNRNFERVVRYIKKRG